MFTETVDRYDDLRREWIAEHSGIWTMQIRRAELLNRRIRRRWRDEAGARPDQHDDHPTHPLFARGFKTVEAHLEVCIVAAAALAAPLGWPLGRLLYTRIEALIPDRLRSYPIPALLWAAAGLGTLTTALYLFRGPASFNSVVIAPWIMAQLPATFFTAGIYGILNGWLAIDGSTDWWPLAPPPATVDFAIQLGADDLTGPPIFPTGSPPVPAQSLTPVTRARGRSPKLILAALLLCAAGTAWTVGAVAVGVKDILAPLTTQDATQLNGL